MQPRKRTGREIYKHQPQPWDDSVAEGNTWSFQSWLWAAESPGVDIPQRTPETIFFNMEGGKHKLWMNTEEKNP